MVVSRFLFVSLINGYLASGYYHTIPDPNRAGWLASGFWGPKTRSQSQLSRVDPRQGGACSFLATLAISMANQ